jgi:hypothetical protein
MKDPIKARVQAEVAERGVAAVAEDIGIPRSTLTSYLAGACRAGTRYQVEARARNLRWDE